MTHQARFISKINFDFTNKLIKLDEEMIDCDYINELYLIERNIITF